MTPRTETSCYYFFTALNGYAPKTEGATEKLNKDIVFTFHEDLEFLENQQACIDATPGQEMVNTKHDVALVPAQKALEAMIDAEAPRKEAAE